MEALANTAQQEAESAGQELQELQLRSHADREAAARELSDAQTDFQQALKGSFRIFSQLLLPQNRLALDSHLHHFQTKNQFQHEVLNATFLVC